MVDWKFQSEDITQPCETKEEAFLRGVMFAIGYFRQDILKVNPADMKAYLDLLSELQIFDTGEKEMKQ